jgi:hypothetical protein
VKTYPTIEAYTADVIRAREAYAADMRVEAGFCESGDGRVSDGRRRQCWSCRLTEIERKRKETS